MLTDETALVTTGIEGQTEQLLKDIPCNKSRFGDSQKARDGRMGKIEFFTASRRNVT
jgi:hypothetical protein